MAGNRKKQYVVGLDYPLQKQERLKRFVGARGFRSVRAFIVMAIDNEIEADLQKMSDDDRNMFEKMIRD